MSGGNRGDRPALILLAIIFGGIVLVSALGLLARYSAPNPVAQADSGGAQTDYGQHGPSEGHWWPEFAARDTYAQWAMTGFAFAATIISVVGVVLLRRTFEETKRTADAAVKSEQTARDIGQAQTRAYLSCVGGSYTVVNQLCVINLTIRNFGASPSPHAVVFGSLIVPNLHSASPTDGFLRTETKTAEVFSIPAGGESEAALTLQISFPTKVRQELFEGEWYVSADCVLQWVDVFNDTQTISFFMIESSRAVERDENLPPRRVGSMKATNVGPYQQRQE